METVVKHFSALSTDELFAIYKLRVSVFVVEQNCPYQEVDDYDKSAYHVFFRDEAGLQGYLRVLPGGTVFPEPSIGRVIAVQRRCGVGSRLLALGIRTAKEKFGAGEIVTAFPDFFDFFKARGFAADDTHAFTPMSTIVRYE